jgi:hypothetical protein
VRYQWHSGNYPEFPLKVNTHHPSIQKNGCQKMRWVSRPPNCIPYTVYHIEYFMGDHFASEMTWAFSKWPNNGNAYSPWPTHDYNLCLFELELRLKAKGWRTARPTIGQKCRKETTCWVVGVISERSVRRSFGISMHGISCLTHLKTLVLILRKEHFRGNG